MRAELGAQCAVFCLQVLGHGLLVAVDPARKHQDE
jgi:hypothetical protein